MNQKQARLIAIEIARAVVDKERRSASDLWFDVVGQDGLPDVDRRKIEAELDRIVDSFTKRLANKE